MTARVCLLLLAACGAAPEHDAAAPTAPTATTGLVIDWTMQVDGDRLRIDYTIKNATASRVTVADALRVSGKPDFDAIVVRADQDASVVAFTRAFVPPEGGNTPRFIPFPHYHDLLPGGELRGSAHTVLPLGASRNYGIAHAIAGTRPNAVLEVEYYDDPAVDETNVSRMPVEAHPPKLLRSTVKPLPATATLASPDEQVARSYGNVIAP